MELGVLVVGYYAVGTADILSPTFQSLAHTLANKIALSHSQLSCANQGDHYYHEAAVGLLPIAIHIVGITSCVLAVEEEEG